MGAQCIGEYKTVLVEMTSVSARQHVVVGGLQSCCLRPACLRGRFTLCLLFDPKDTTHHMFAARPGHDFVTPVYCKLHLGKVAHRTACIVLLKVH